MQLHTGISQVDSNLWHGFFWTSFVTAGDTRGIDETADPESMPANRKSSTVFATVVLVGSLVIFAAAGMFAWALQSKHQKYEALSQSDLTEQISRRNRSQRSSSDA